MNDDALRFCKEAPIEDFLDRIAGLISTNGLDVVSLSREVARAIDWAEGRGRVAGIKAAKAHIRDIAAANRDFTVALQALEQLGEMQQKIVERYFGKSEPG